MTLLRPAPPRLDPASAAPLLAHLGFVASSDLPDRPGPAYLMVALRDPPTLHHFDPELVDYWVTDRDRGVRRTLTRQTRVPVATDFSWGLIRLVDRLQVTNEYLTFGGGLAVDRVDDDTIAVFTSPAPILRRGGHSQGWDAGAETLGAFFSRFLLAVDYVPGFERRAAHADPIARYAAFLADVLARSQSSQALRVEHLDLWTLLQAEAGRIRERHPDDWRAGIALRDDAMFAMPGARSAG